MSDAGSTSPEFFTVVCSTCHARVDPPVKTDSYEVKCPDCFKMLRVPSRVDVDAHLAKQFKRTAENVDTYSLSAPKGDTEESDDAPDYWVITCGVCQARLTPELRDEPFEVECHDCFVKYPVPSLKEAKQQRPSQFREMPNAGTYSMSRPAIPEYEVEVSMEAAESFLKPKAKASEQAPKPAPNRSETAEAGAKSTSSGITCPDCGAGIEAEPKRFTRRVTCECGSKVAIPASSDAAPPQQSSTEDDDDIFGGAPSTPRMKAAPKSESKPPPPKKTAGPVPYEPAAVAAQDDIPELLEFEDDDDDEDAPLDLEEGLTDEDGQPKLRKKRKKRKKKKRRKSVDAGSSQHYEPTPPGGFLAAQGDLRITDEGDPPPEKLFFSNVFQYPWNPDVLSRWIWMSVCLGFFGLLLGVVGALMAASGVPVMALPILLVVLTFVGIFTLGYTVANSIRILLESAAGNDRVRDWASSAWKEWIVELLPMVWLVGLAAALAAIPTMMARTVMGPAVGGYAFAASVYLAYPILVLSWIETNSFVAPASIPILASLFKIPKDWAVYFGLTIAVNLPVFLLINSFSGKILILIYLLSGPLMAALAIINARLLGRMAWQISLNTEPPEGPEAPDHWSDSVDAR